MKTIGEIKQALERVQGVNFTPSRASRVVARELYNLCEILEDEVVQNPDTFALSKKDLISAIGELSYGETNEDIPRRIASIRGVCLKESGGQVGAVGFGETEEDAIDALFEQLTEGRPTISLSTFVNVDTYMKWNGRVFAWAGGHHDDRKKKEHG